MRESSSYLWRGRRSKTAAQHYEERRERRRQQMGYALLPVTVESIVDHENLYQVFQTVRQGGEAPGIDGVSHHDLSNSEAGRIMIQLSKSILEGTYRPHPTHAVNIPKPGSNEWRTLKIGVLCDRVVAKALYSRLNWLWESIFLPCSYGFRQAMSPWKMLAELEVQMVQQNRWVLAVDDLKSAFENVPIEATLLCHQRMLGTLRMPDDKEERLQYQQQQSRLMELINTVIRGNDPQRGRGIDQGNPYSPLCLNAVLHYGLDEPVMAMMSTPLWFRYADNLVYLAKSVSEGELLLRLVCRLLRPLGLTLKGKDGVHNLTKGNEAQILGFTLRREGNKVIYGLGKEALNHLSQNLGLTHVMPHPDRSAKASLLGWVDAMGPAFENGVTELSRILQIAASYGYRELASPGELRQQWETSWIRWQETRDRAYCPR